MFHRCVLVTVGLLAVSRWCLSGEGGSDGFCAGAVLHGPGF